MSLVTIHLLLIGQHFCAISMMIVAKKYWNQCRQPVSSFSRKNPKEIIKLDDGKLKVVFDDDKEDMYDTVLYATGRVADTIDLGLENVGIELVDDRY